MESIHSPEPLRERKEENILLKYCVVLLFWCFVTFLSFFSKINFVIPILALSSYSLYSSLFSFGEHLTLPTFFVFLYSPLLVLVVFLVFGEEGWWGGWWGGLIVLFGYVVGGGLVGGPWLSGFYIPSEKKKNKVNNKPPSECVKIHVDYFVPILYPLKTQGKIGMTVAPGRVAGQPTDRDMKSDLYHLKNTHNCDVLVTMLHENDLKRLETESMFEEAQKLGISTIRYQIRDRFIPISFRSFCELIELLFDLVMSGKNVVIHCNGGKGRTGLVVVCLLMRMGGGWLPSLQKLRHTRKGTLYNPLQQVYSLSYFWWWRGESCSLSSPVGVAHAFYLLLSRMKEGKRRRGVVLEKRREEEEEKEREKEKEKEKEKKEEEEKGEGEREEGGKGEVGEDEMEEEKKDEKEEEEKKEEEKEEKEEEEEEKEKEEENDKEKEKEKEENKGEKKEEKKGGETTNTNKKTGMSLSEYLYTYSDELLSFSNAGCTPFSSSPPAPHHLPHHLAFLRPDCHDYGRFISWDFYESCTPAPLFSSTTPNAPSSPSSPLSSSPSSPTSLYLNQPLYRILALRLSSWASSGSLPLSFSHMVGVEENQSEYERLQNCTKEVKKCLGKWEELSSDTLISSPSDKPLPPPPSPPISAYPIPYSPPSLEGDLGGEEEGEEGEGEGEGLLKKEQKPDNEYFYMRDLCFHPLSIPHIQREKELIILLEQLGARGIQTMFGLRCTAGAAQALPPSYTSLVASFNSFHGKKEKNPLTVGARAHAKHAHRSSEGWWGSVSGSNPSKNERANEVMKKITSNVIWQNCHFLSAENPVYEIRCEEGYGMRWDLSGGDFRGFLEPQMTDGYEKGYRH